MVVGLGKKTPTRNAHAYQLVKTIFNTAREDKLITENPCQIKTAGRPPKPRDVQALTPAELVKVAEAAPEAYRAAVPVAAWCGLRFGELIELRRKDVHVSGDRTVLKSAGPPRVSITSLWLARRRRTRASVT